MKRIGTQIITDRIAELVIDTNRRVDSDVLDALEMISKTETKELALHTLNIIIENHKIANNLILPICQDTGTAVFFVEIGHEVIIDGNLENAINEGVSLGYLSGFLRNSIVLDPIFDRTNTNNNTPAIIHTSFCEGDSLRIIFIAKGGGSENMSRLAMMKPSDSVEFIKDFVLETIIDAGANPCPPLIIGIGIGGNFEQCAILSKMALLRKIGERNSNKNYAKLEQDILLSVNEKGCGIQGFGGDNTALDVFIEYLPCHIASLPVAVNIQCHASRHGSIVL